MPVTLPRETIVETARVLQQDRGGLTLGISELLAHAPSADAGSDVAITLDDTLVADIAKALAEMAFAATEFSGSAVMAKRYRVLAQAWSDVLDDN